MNKPLIILLAIFGGAEVIFYIVTPIMVSIIWVLLFHPTKFITLIISLVGSMASLFRGIKVGFLKE